MWWGLKGSHWAASSVAWKEWERQMMYCPTYCTAICHKVLVMIYIYIYYHLSYMIDIYCQIVYVIYIYIFKYSIFYHMVVHLLRMVAKSCTSWWFILWFIGFQPSVWRRGISQPSTVCARNSQIEGQLLQVLVTVRPKSEFSWCVRRGSIDSPGCSLPLTGKRARIPVLKSSNGWLEMEV